jgi:hypothetical protein
MTGELTTLPLAEQCCDDAAHARLRAEIKNASCDEFGVIASASIHLRMLRLPGWFWITLYEIADHRRQSSLDGRSG